METLADGDRVAAQVRVEHGDVVFWCAGFYRVVEGMIESGVEHWVTERSNSPPAWRRPFASELEDVEVDSGSRPPTSGDAIISPT